MRATVLAATALLATTEVRCLGRRQKGLDVLQAIVIIMTLHLVRHHMDIRGEERRLKLFHILGLILTTA